MLDKADVKVFKIRRPGKEGSIPSLSKLLVLNLQEEGSLKAEAAKHSEAIRLFDKALGLTPTRAVLHELKAQVRMPRGSSNFQLRRERCCRSARIFAAGISRDRSSLGRNMQCNYSDGICASLA